MLMAAFALTAFLLTAKDRRTDQALDELVLEYGFQDVTLGYEPDWVTDYSAPMMSEQQGEDVLRKLEEICLGWEIDVIDTDSPEFREGVSPIHNFSTQPGGRRVFIVIFLTDSRTPSAIAHGASPEMTLLMTRAPEGPGILDRLKDLWPW